MDYERLLDPDDEKAAEAASQAVHDAVWEDIHILPRGTAFKAADSRLPEGLTGRVEERMAAMQNETRVIFIHMLGKVGGEEAVDVLKRILVQQIGEGGNDNEYDKPAVYHALQSLSRIGGLRAFQTLLGLRDHPKIATQASVGAHELFIRGTADYTEPSAREMERSSIFVKRWATVPPDVQGEE